MGTKIYHLLPHTDSTAPIYRRVSADQRVRMTKRIIDHPYLIHTFNDQAETVKDRNPDSPTFDKPIANPRLGKNVTCRLKLTSNSIYQDEQIKEGILANTPVTQAERDAVKFNYGVLVTSNPIVQWYLETIPAMNGFKGLCDEVRQPLYDVFDPNVKSTEQNKDIRRRTAAIVKILAIEDLKEAQDLIIRLNGSYVATPDNIGDCQNSLCEFIDAGGDAEIDELMKDEITVDQSVTILIGRAIREGILSFDQEPNYVSKKKGDGWVNVKMVSGDVDKVERERLFTVFLSSPEGRLLQEDLKAEIAKVDKKKSKLKEKEKEKQSEVIA